MSEQDFEQRGTYEAAVERSKLLEADIADNPKKISCTYRGSSYRKTAHWTLFWFIAESRKIISVGCSNLYFDC